jgi:hypothetical protein
MSNVLKAAEDLLKSPEQLAGDKQAKLDKRIPKLKELDGASKDKLVEIVKILLKNLKI